MGFFVHLLSLLMLCLPFYQTRKEVRYLPLGDSYTICTGATEKESWPYLLAQHLNEKQTACRLLDNPARNGFSTQNLIDEELPLLPRLKPDFVTLLIGVNDWVRQVPLGVFKKNLEYILDETQKALPDKRKIVLITIPDFGVTPQGKHYGGGRHISSGIAAFNTVIKQQALARRLPLADVFELSKKMGEDSSLVAADGLHPSASEYALWEKLIFEKAEEVLR